MGGGLQGILSFILIWVISIFTKQINKMLKESNVEEIICTRIETLLIIIFYFNAAIFLTIYLPVIFNLISVIFNK